MVVVGAVELRAECSHCRAEVDVAAEAPSLVQGAEAGRMEWS